MKKGILLIIVLSAMLSCSKDNDVKPKPSMKAKVNGIEWNAVTRITALSDNKFFITGTALDAQTLLPKQSLSITIIGITEGTYVLGLNSVQCEAIYKESISATSDDAYVALSGTVVLTKVNTTAKEISGTYNFILKRTLTGTTVTIAEGSFTNLSYTETSN